MVQKMEFSNVSALPLKIVFLVHFLLSTWGVQGYWSPSSYTYYNLIFFFIIFWGLLHKDSDEPVQLAVLVNLCCILFDIIVLCTYFPSSYASSERFSVGMAILNLVIRPVTTVMLYRIFQERAGVYGTFPGNIGHIFGGARQQRSPYEDIDNTVHSVPRAAGDIGNTAPYPGVHTSEKMSPPYQ